MKASSPSFSLIYNQLNLWSSIFFFSLLDSFVIGISVVSGSEPK